MATATLTPPPRSTANPAPARPSGSLRRTSSIDVSWPDGEMGDRLFVGRARDYYTPALGGAGRVVDEAGYRATLSQDKTITAMVGEPEDARLARLVGVRGGNHLRLFIKENLPELIASGAPLYLPLDDISGTALVSAFAWSQWHEDWAAKLRERMGSADMERMMADRINVCWGLQEGHSGVSADGPPKNVADAEAGDVRNPADPEGWHALFENEGAGFRRARRIDVTRGSDGLIHIDAAFQDSAKRKDQGRVAIHEYNIVATADPTTLEILSLEPEARILPFSECPGAIHNARRLVGTRISDARDMVLAKLRGPEGCTHLNDALRALAEVPKLAEDLAQAEA